MLIAIPLAVSSTGYALFSQNLSVNANTNKVAYSSSQNLLFTYDKSTSPQGQSFNYTISPARVKNNGTATIDSWQVKFDLPADASQLNCTSATCSQLGNTVTASSTPANKTVTPGSTVTFSVTFKTGVEKYTLQNVYVSGTIPANYQTITGLNVVATAGARSKSGKNWVWPYTFTVTNLSGQAITGWRIQAPWDANTNTVISMPATVSYVASTTQLTMTRPVALANGSSFQFTTELASTSNSWVLTGYTVQGSL